MSGTISVSPSPATRGQSITIKVGDATPGVTITLTGEDENGNSFTVPVTIDSNGNATTTVEIPSTWGATLEISGAGLQSYTGVVQGPKPSPSRKKKKTPRTPAKSPAKRRRK